MLAHLKHCARQRFAARALRNPCFFHRDNPALVGNPRHGERVPIGPVIKAQNQRNNLFGGVLKINRAKSVRAFEFAKILARAKRLRLAGHLWLREAAHQLGKTAQRAFIGFCVQRQGRVLWADVKRHLQNHIPGIDLRLHKMPADRVLSLAAEPRPDRRVEPRILGQGTIMKVDASATRQAQNRLRQKLKIGHRQQPVGAVVAQAVRQTLPRVEHRDLLRHRPAAQRRHFTDQTGDVMPSLQPKLRTAAGKALVADEDG